MTSYVLTKIIYYSCEKWSIHMMYLFYILYYAQKNRELLTLEFPVFVYID